MIGLTRTEREAVLRECGAGDPEVEQLLGYNDNVFDRSSLPEQPGFPLADEPFVKTWDRYVQDSGGSLAYLCDKLPQLRFPIRAGISQSDEYRAATLRGRATSEMTSATGLALRRADLSTIELHSTPAGRIPLLIIRDREDFVSVLRALARRNEPDVIPDSMGAMMIAGYNNWDRIRTLRIAWEQRQAFPPSEAEWQAEFQRIVSEKDLYQDRFIILSDGPYSGVPGRALGLGEDEWRAISLNIRREHECTHYFTRRVFSSMRNNLLDELIADYVGILEAAGAFRADWFLRFVGLENYPTYRAGGRLENYRGELSEAAFAVLQTLVRRAALHLEQYKTDGQPDLRALMILTLTGFTLEELASTDAPARIAHRAAQLAGQSHALETVRQTAASQ